MVASNNITLKTANLGFPRMGRKRELKFALEGYWAGKKSEQELLDVARTLRKEHWKLQKNAGIDYVPVNDFSLYDHMLDALVLIGATPERFGSGPVTLERYFAMARNSTEQTAMEMTKWFDTNYHYLVPEWSANIAFQANTEKLLGELREARSLGVSARPVLVGPLTLLLQGKGADGFNPLHLAMKIAAVYVDVLQQLKAESVEWIQIDEPALVTDLPEGSAAAFKAVYAELAKVPVKLMLTTYFDSLGANLSLAVDLHTAGVHIDLVRAPDELDDVLRVLKPGQVLSLGVVEGRNIWLTDFAAAEAMIAQATKELGKDRVILAPSCSLLHAPHTLLDETKINPRVKGWLRFAQEKLAEVLALASMDAEAAKANGTALADRTSAETSTNAELRTKIDMLSDVDFRRSKDYKKRAATQRIKFGLPLFPTTTIGSFPQTAEVRKHRAAYKNGHETVEEYETFLRHETEFCIRKQEEIGLDVLVHGEFERNDMVEYFAEFLDGFLFTENGWVQSYGSRCVKPPVIYGEVTRPVAMTVGWSKYAASLTKRPMKGMLTGPITILQWSFVRNDIPRWLTAWEIALALREEVNDLETAGIGMIQVDEPALREGLPLKRAQWDAYLHWAVKAFKLTTSSAKDETQIHTHMCYCEFDDVLPAIAALDADVISMETARSRMELLQAFHRHKYPNEIGPGVYDIHSPRVPNTAEMKELLEMALETLKPEQLWVNPDCGLKTRGWVETEDALRNMCAAAAELRANRTT